eukprot:CAMPEP_0206822710 /NCGR_PEP_ID=MMETSP0975-20121206/12956_1 /ASSEMBLY_ACC=CAM_ASM_000399 /TAXON_ID=483370 /ORGANISM="non described non described, Strain CCMP2097" /LENGTH=146 /DNA_ID=CAMNT_0054364957 /DNA_START=236 /DNA_END=676 /DNA_ORIENTATION=-
MPQRRRIPKLKRAGDVVRPRARRRRPPPPHRRRAVERPRQPFRGGRHGDFIAWAAAAEAVDDRGEGVVSTFVELLRARDGVCWVVSPWPGRPHASPRPRRPLLQRRSAAVVEDSRLRRRAEVSAARFRDGVRPRAGRASVLVAEPF